MVRNSWGISVYGAASVKARPGLASESTEEDLAPGHVVVSAAVILGFAIEHE